MTTLHFGLIIIIKLHFTSKSTNVYVLHNKGCQVAIAKILHTTGRCKVVVAPSQSRIRRPQQPTLHRAYSNIFSSHVSYTCRPTYVSAFKIFRLKDSNRLNCMWMLTTLIIL